MGQREITQLRTGGKGADADALHALRERDGFQMRAVGKRTVDLANAVLNHDASQVIAAGKGGAADILHGAGNRDLRQIVGAERIFTDSLKAVRKGHGGEAEA